MYSTMMTPVWTETPNSARNPTPEETLKFTSGEIQREQAADGRHRDVGQNQQRPFHGREHRVENDEDQQQRERHDDRQAALRALCAFVLARPIDVIAGAASLTSRPRS